MSIQQLSLFGEQVGEKKSTPPKGYIRFKMKGATANDIICPNCGIKGAGMGFGGGGWQDPKAQAFAEEQLKKRNDALCQIFEDKMLKEHWSRYFKGDFLCCGAKIWHGQDFEDQYYLPKRFTYEEKQAYLKKREEWRKEHDRQIQELMDSVNVDEILNSPPPEPFDEDEEPMEEEE